MVFEPPLTSSSGEVTRMNREILTMRSTVAMREETVVQKKKTNKVFVGSFERLEPGKGGGGRVTHEIWTEGSSETIPGLSSPG